MIRVDIIKQISDGDNIYREGDKVKLIMKDNKKYVGTISAIHKDGGFIDYSNISMPFNVNDIRSIEKVDELDIFCKEFEKLLYSSDVNCSLENIKTVIDAMGFLQSEFKNN